MPQNLSTQNSRASHKSADRQSINRVFQDASLEETLLKHDAVQRSQLHPTKLSASDVMQLQRTIGNQQVARLLGRQNHAPVQRKVVSDDHAASSDRISRNMVSHSKDGQPGPKATFAAKTAPSATVDTAIKTQRSLHIQRDGEEGQQQKKSPWNKVRAGLKDIPTLMDPTSKDMMKTKQGTTWAARQRKKGQMPDPSAYMTTDEIASHLEHFKSGGHAFVTPEKHALIHKGSGRGGYGGWGLDSNFISPLSEADALTQDAHENEGIYTLEDRLGIPHGTPWSWANPTKNPKNVMFRYKLRKPDNFGLRMPKGVEANAYAEEWEAGGVTLGGRKEAVINNLSLGDLIDAEVRKDLVIEQETFPETPKPATS